MQYSFDRSEGDSEGKLAQVNHLLNKIQQGESRFNLAFSDLLNTPNITEKLNTLDLFKLSTYIRGFRKFTELFITSIGYTTSFHMDGSSLFSMQFQGQKEWIIVHLRWSYLMRPIVTRTPYVVADETLNDDVIKNLEARDISFDRILVEAGDVLYLPSFYWHYVKKLSTSITVVRRWSNVKSTLNHPFWTFIIATSTQGCILKKKTPFLKRFPY
jgi:hypothetical protein